MTFDGSTAPSTSSAGRIGPAQHAIHRFLAAHRLRPGRNAGARLVGRSPLLDTDSYWFWTAAGQLDVMADLDRLGPAWAVVHGIPGMAGAGDPAPSAIDHLVIGPAGVFAINTYNHTRQSVWVSSQAFVADGHRLQYIRRAEAAVGQVERMLEAATGRSIRASTIIAVIHPGSLNLGDLPRDVFVVDAAALGSWLTGRAREVDADFAAELAAAARLEGTWSDTPVSRSDAEAAADERAQFERVRREVATARIIRSVWTIGLAALLTGGLVAVGVLQLVTVQP